MKLTFRLIPYILIQILILFLIGVYELFSADWNWGTFVSADFWSSYATTITITMLSFFSWANFCINKILDTPYYKDMETQSGVDLNNLGNQVAIKKNNLNNLVINYRTSDITDFLYECVNMPEKKNKFKFKKLNKLQRLKNSSLRYTKIFSKYYNKKISNIEEQLTDKWLDENLEHTKVRYVPVTERYIVNGVDTVGSSTFRKKQEAKYYKMAKDNLPKWLMSLSYMLLLSSITFTKSDTLTLQVIFTVLIKILNCILQSVMGANYASTYVKEKVIVELDDRISIMEAYAEYKIKRKENT